jgi:hypothetical protein
MTATIGVDLVDDNKFCQVYADLKRYRLHQLDNMHEPNSKLVVEYLNSKMREANLKPATRANTIDRLSRISHFHKNKSLAIFY